MRQLTLILAATLLATPAFAGWNKVDSKQELSQHVVGKNFIEPESKGWFSLRSNGSLAGGYQGKKLTGKWKWTKGRVCYSRKLGGKALPDNCIVIHVDGNKLTTTRQNGTTVNYVRAK